MIDKSLALDQNPSSELFYNRRSLFSVQSLKTADLALTIVHAFFWQAAIALFDRDFIFKNEEKD